MSARPFRPGVVFQREKQRLCIFSDAGVTVLLPWPKPMAFRKTIAQPSWQGCRPLISLRRRSAAAVGIRQDSPGGADDPDLADSAPAAAPASPGPDCAAEPAKPTKEECYNNYLALIPADVRRAIGRFRKRQWQMLQFAARVPGGLDLMGGNPALAFMVANNWVFRRPAPTQPLRAARSLVRKRQREIAVWLGFPHDREHPESVVRILGKIVPAAITVPGLLYLRDALRDPDAVRLLRHARRLNAGALRVITDPEWRRRVTPTFIAEVAARRSEDRFPETTTIMADYLRMCDRCGREQPRREVFGSRRRLIDAHDELADRLNARGLHGLPGPDVKLPPPPLPGDAAAGIQPLASAGELASWGAAQRNCILSFVDDVAGGGVYLYKVVRDGEHATLSVVRRGSGWHAGQLLGFRNREVSTALRDAVIDWFDANRPGGESDRQLSLFEPVAEPADRFAGEILA